MFFLKLLFFVLIGSIVLLAVVRFSKPEHKSNFIEKMRKIFQEHETEPTSLPKTELTPKEYGMLLQNSNKHRVRQAKQKRRLK